MKKAIFSLMFIACIHVVHAQNIDSLDAKIDSLEKRLNSDNYTRIPNKDFDNILTQRVNEEVSDQIDNVKKWIAIIEGLIIVCLGFLAKYYFKDLVQKELNTTSDKLETNIKGFIDKRMVDTIGVIWEDGASNLLRKAKELNYQDESIINSISHFLETENLKLTDDLKLDLITALVKCYFYSAKRDKIERLIQIITKYENEKIKLRPETYADAAIVFCDNYEFYGTPYYYNAAIDYCDKSITTLPDYGIPYAIKFEVFMINHKKAMDNNESAKAIDNVSRLFKAIDNNKSDVVCAETIVRFHVDKKVYLKDYLEELENKFPNELKAMYQRAFNYLSKTPSYAANPDPAEVFNDLKKQGYVQT